MKRYLYVITIYSALFIIAGCGMQPGNERVQNNRLKNNTKEWGGDNNMKRLEPMIIESRYAIYNIGEIKRKNCFGTMTSNREFAIGTIGKNGSVSVEPIVKGFPPNDSFGRFSTDPFGSMMWVVDGREIVVIDADTKKTGKALTSPDGDDMLSSIYIVDRNKKLLYVETIELRGKNPNDMYYQIYDLNENRIVYKSSMLKGLPYPFSPGKLLFCKEVEFKKKGEYVYKSSYSITDLFEKETVQNALTKKMTKVGIDLDLFNNPIRTEAGKLIGSIEFTDKDDLTFFVDQLVTWKENYEDVKINPIIAQKPKNGRLSHSFVLSGDGKWAVTRFKYDASIIDVPELIIYHLSDIYPQGISMPIYCGYSKKGTKGAFVDHEVWGPCYIELNNKFPNKLFVFKLYDGLKVMAENAKEAAMNMK